MVSPTSRIPGICNQHAGEFVDVLPHQGFAAGEADLVHAERGRDADESRDLLERQEFGTVRKTTSSGMQ